MKKYVNTHFSDIFSEKEKKVIGEFLEIVRNICKKSTKADPKLFLIGMKALYYYFGTEVFSPAPISLDIDINFDILLEWINYRKLIPQKIKESLELLGYHVEVELGQITIQKEDIIIHLTTVIEFSKEIIGTHIPELNLDIANKYFLIYTKLSRFNPYKDVPRLQNLFKHCEIDVEKILEFAPELERDIIKERISFLLKKNN